MYYIYQLKFTSPVHFGSAHLGGGLEKSGIEFLSDNMFSAICTELATINEIELLNALVQAAKNGKLSLSDLFPYKADLNGHTSFYISRPQIDLDIDVPDGDLNKARKRLANEKALCSEPYLKISELQKYLAMFKSGRTYIRSEAITVAESDVSEKVNCRGIVSMPYFIKDFSFVEGAGLYGILKVNTSSCTEEHKLVNVFQRILELLGYSGIGGKKSSGYGKFELLGNIFAISEANNLEDIKKLREMLNKNVAEWYMSISLVHPSSSDISTITEGWYELKKRSGFTENQKRSDIYMLAAGSCFKKKIAGDIVDISNKGINHPVYKYGIGMYMGLDL